VVKEVLAEERYLERRHDELNDIKKITSQIVDLSNHMRSDVQAQGDNMNKIESHVGEIKENAKRAEFEIETAEKETRGSSKKYIILCLIILFFVVSMCALTYFILLGDKGVKTV
jgi:t-SNARE complex subunit (syntaxin)